MDNMNNPYNRPVQADAPWFIMWLVISIVQALTCNTLTGIISVVLIVLGNQDYKNGLVAKAEQKKKIAMIVTIIGVILSVIIITLVFAFIGFSAWEVTNYMVS